MAVTDLGAEGLLLELGGWHEGRLSRASVIRLFDRALSGAVRVTDFYVNGRPWRHVAEVTDDGGGWSCLGQIGFFRLSFFRRVVTTAVRRYPGD